MCKVMFQKLTIGSQILRRGLEAPHRNLKAQVSVYKIQAMVFFNHLGHLLTFFLPSFLWQGIQRSRF